MAGSALRIIPVLDLKGGEVVRAEQGQRHRYRPIVTPLAESADAVAVAAGLRTLYPFQIFYIADLDAIEGRAPNAAALARLRTMPQAPELWVDAGVTALWVDKDSYEAPAGEPTSTFNNRPGTTGPPDRRLRDVTIKGDTRFDIELVRR